MNKETVLLWPGNVRGSISCELRVIDEIVGLVVSI